MAARRLPATPRPGSLPSRPFKSPEIQSDWLGLGHVLTTNQSLRPVEGGMMTDLKLVTASHPGWEHSLTKTSGEKDGIANKNLDSNKK